ncbi:hypothetical protein [Sediminibacterium soli]|uniref:hypothetical protein n=1 Tax=Sediminibacterium soli TaxID=2698829 RepID=UPI00137A785D|nr:hypothetical protein [Sediminibacterium soli]NCI47833.1 hypothetical protein [Sediminibacterium soli]
MCTAGIVLAAPHQSVTRAATVRGFSEAIVTCRIDNCSKRGLAAVKKPVSAFMHESAATLYW